MRKKSLDVFFYNCVYRPGHMYYDTKLITALSEASDSLSVFQPKDWFNVNLEHTHYINKGLTQNKKTKFKRMSIWWRSFLNSFRAVREIKKSRPNFVVVGEYELSTFWITINSLLSTGAIVIIVHHNNIDQIVANKRKRKLFDLYKDRVVHCTLEPFIEDFTSSHLNIAENRVLCWPHPSERLQETSTDISSCEKVYDVIGLSQSNDEKLIDYLIRLEKKDKIFQKYGLRVLLKSKVQAYDDGALTVMMGWIDDNDYMKYYQSTKCVLVAFPQSYQFRVSATLIEALRDRIPVLGSNIRLINYYHEAYPNICCIYNTDTFVYDIINFLSNNHDQDKEFVEFFNNHSDKYIVDKIHGDLVKLANTSNSSIKN